MFERKVKVIYMARYIMIQYKGFKHTWETRFNLKLTRGSIRLWNGKKLRFF